MQSVTGKKAVLVDVAKEVIVTVAKGYTAAMQPVAAASWGNLLEQLQNFFPSIRHLQTKTFKK